MKPKLYLFCLLSLVAMGFADAQEIVNIPDENFKNYLVTNTDINTNSDNEIQVSEAEAFTGTIDCSSKGITDLTGIEAFVNIKQLNCSVNQLENLNLTKNKALENLNCFNNQLKNLDITQNTALQVLYCVSNELTSLNVSENTALTDLRCNSNQLTNLDVSQNTVLQILLCYDNPLTSLNIKNGNNTVLEHMQAQNNPNLSCIQVDNVADANAKSNWQKGTADYNTDCNATLPVTLLTFTAKTDGNYALLQWKTAVEQNNKGFEIYRSGDDGVFIKVGNVAATMRTDGQLTVSTYAFTDKQALNGKNYYKLVQIDNDGKENELGVRSLSFSFSAFSLHLYPNPALNEVTLKWNDNNVVTVVKLIDLSGKVLQIIKPQASSRSITVPLFNYPIGTYFFRVERKEGIESLKVVKL